jgi:hypothetical protein
MCFYLNTTRGGLTPEWYQVISLTPNIPSDACVFEPFGIIHFAGWSAPVHVRPNSTRLAFLGYFRPFRVFRSVPRVGRIYANRVVDMKDAQSIRINHVSANAVRFGPLQLNLPVASNS